MRIPKHIGVIPDGNRRWAKENGYGKEEGYGYGLDPGVRLLRIAKEYGIEEMTYYGFTVDNCKRPKVQVQAFQNACVEAVKRIAKEDVSLVVVGNTNSTFFPDELRQFTNIQHKENKMKVNFLVNYGWQWDLKQEHASKEISRIDMIIRWGGMRRLSGFLPIQSVYADFFIVEELWPNFKEEQFKEAISWYQNQDITLGG